MNRALAVSHEEEEEGEEIDDALYEYLQRGRVQKSVCTYGCNKVLASRTIDYHRLNGCRGKADDAFADLSKRRSFICGVCYEEYITRESFFNHLAYEHDVHPTIQPLTFPDLATFERFRHWIEMMGGAHFRQKSGSKARTTGRGMFWMCNRSGLVHTTAPTGDAKKDKTGSYRTGFTCTAFINGSVHPNGHVSIRFCGDHYGHDVRMRVPQCVKNIIIAKQQANATNAQIMRYLQHHFFPYAHTDVVAKRVCLIDLDELRSFTPISKKLEAADRGPQYEKEEPWEDEWLDKFGFDRSAIQRRSRPDDWIPIQKLAEELEWPVPRVFNTKVRDAHGNFMLAENYHEELYMRVAVGEYGEDTRVHARVQEALGGNEERKRKRKVNVVNSILDAPDDADGVNDNAEEAAESRFSPVTEIMETDPQNRNPRRRRVEISIGRADGTAHEAHKEIHHPDHSGGKSTRQAWEPVEDPSGLPQDARRTFIVASIMAELDMIKCIVKDQEPYQTLTDLSSFLRRTRELKNSFEPSQYEMDESISRKRPNEFPYGVSRPRASRFLKQQRTEIGMQDQFCRATERANRVALRREGAAAAYDDRLEWSGSGTNPKQEELDDELVMADEEGVMEARVVEGDELEPDVADDDDDMAIGHKFAGFNSKLWG